MPKWRNLHVVIIGLMLLTILLNAQTSLAADDPRDFTYWTETFITIPNPSFCFDNRTPDTLLVAQSNDVLVGIFGAKGTYSVDLRKATKTKVSDYLLDPAACGEQSGVYFGTAQNGAKVRFTTTAFAGTPTEHVADKSLQAKDGTLQMYALDNDSLWSSVNGGSSWEKRSPPFSTKGATLASLAVAQADARTIYMVEQTTGATPNAIYFSSDAGITWQKRFSQATIGNNEPTRITSITVVPGGSVNALRIVNADPNKPDRVTATNNTVFLSIDGGRTVNMVGTNSISGRVDLYQTSAGLVRISPVGVSLSADGGKTWQVTTLPFTPMNQLSLNHKHSANLVDSFVVLDDKSNLWYSADGAKTWLQLPTPKNSLFSYDFTPNAPLKLIGLSFDEATKGFKIDTIDLPSATKNAINGVAPNNAPNGSYFQDTRHNLSGPFKTYWEANGGVAQFGYPKTEPFREVNSADGKIYTVQYFERNRFEYHPENVRTPYEVQLGLLGYQLTNDKRDKKDGAFNRFANAKYPNGLYFNETGHNLRNSFKDYWQANGGLSLYGYPISEEYEEINPDDGKTYVVQYFERNRFEYHSENKGTKFEVLLGLLGNSLLRDRGWLN